MGILLGLLTLPVLGSPRFAHWLARTMMQQAEQESLDLGSLRGRLLELQERYASGELEQEEYDRLEDALLGQINAAWLARERRRGGA